MAILRNKISKLSKSQVDLEVALDPDWRSVPLRRNP